MIFLHVCAIMDRLKVNWAQVIYNNLTKHQTSFLPLGAFFTHIFKKFKVKLSSESNVVRSFELFDHSTFLRMKLLNFQTPPPTSTSQEPPSIQALLEIWMHDELLKFYHIDI